MIKAKATLRVMGEDAWKDSRIRQWVKDGNTAMFLEQEDCTNINFPVGTLAYSDRCHPKKQ